MIICTCCSKSMKSHKIGVAVLEMDDLNEQLLAKEPLHV